MIIPIRIGVDLRADRAPVFLNVNGLSRHVHLVGATGTGKTVGIQALLKPLLMEPREKACVFLIDPMGNLSVDLLRWIASRECPDHVRRRLVYMEPARSEFVVPFNPLYAIDDDSRYYQVARAVDLILRAWKAQDLSLQPRLMQWSYKAVAAMAAMGLPLAMSRFLLHPGTQEHSAILQRLPDDISYHWAEILNARGSEPTRILESTRNRFDPIYEAPQTRRMFGTLDSRLDVERFIRERRIVILNVARLGRLPRLLGSTIGSLVANEVFETAWRMATLYGRSSVEPTYLLLDECQMFVSPDIEDSLPTCRQMGLRLILAHQSFSQLQQADIDLTSMIWQARNRLMFANSAEDADMIAEELATQTFDMMAIKDQRVRRTQLITGYRTVWLESEGVTDTHADSTLDQRTTGSSRGDSTSIPRYGIGGSRGEQRGHNEARVTGGTHADSQAHSRSRSQHLVPIHETIEETASITFRSFEEHRQEWRRIVRELTTGMAFGKFVDDSHLYRILIDHRPTIVTPRLEARFQELLQRNFEQDIFISAERADQLAEQHRRALLTQPPIHVPPNVTDADSAAPSPAISPFRKPPRRTN